MPPVITSLNPASGPVGSNVLITGTGFIVGGVGGTVTFNGMLAAPSTYNGTQIIVPVPAGATTGNVVVTVAGQSSAGVLFTVTTLAAPTIVSITPATGPVGISVTIAGTNFGAFQGNSSVRFFSPPFLIVQSIAAQIVSWSNTSIVAIVPPNAAGALGEVLVLTSGGQSNAVSFVAGPGPSNGGTAAPIGLLLIPAQQFNTQVVLTFDTNNFNDPSSESFYFWKVEEVIAGRTPSCTRQIIQYRDLGVATVTFTLSGYDQNTQAPTSTSFPATIGTVAATGKIATLILGMNLTAQNLQFSMERDPGAGPVSLVSVELMGRVERTAYA